MKSRSRQMFEKSVQAMLAAIEIYNKPNFDYREETFSILAVNAWELLFKARILLLEKNRISSILEYERRENNDGTPSEKLYRKKNRAGNHCSISILKAQSLLINEYGDKIDSNVIKNIEALLEIRDNAIHYLNKGFNLKKTVHEIGTANLKNYLSYSRQWFGENLDQYQLFLMPLAFFRNISDAKIVALNSSEKNILEYISNKKKDVDDKADNDFNFALNMDIKFNRSSSPDLTKVTISTSPDAIPISLSESDVREKYPWDYNNLTSKLKKRYTDFKANQDYHNIRQPLEDDDKYCHKRHLDPGNHKSSIKKFYNPNILQEFDTHYKRK